MHEEKKIFFCSLSSLRPGGGAKGLSGLNEEKMKLMNVSLIFGRLPLPLPTEVLNPLKKNHKHAKCMYI